MACPVRVRIHPGSTVSVFKYTVHDFFLKCKWEISLCCRFIRAELCRQIRGTVTKSLRYQFIAPVHTNPDMSWKILIIVDNVYKGFSFIVCLMIVTLMLIATFRPHTAGLHQAIVSIYWVGLFVPLWLLVIGVSQTSLMVGGFRSKALLSLLVLWEEETDPSAVRCGRNLMFETAFFFKTNRTRMNEQIHLFSVDKRPPPEIYGLKVSEFVWTGPCLC